MTEFEGVGCRYSTCQKSKVRLEIAGFAAVYVGQNMLGTVIIEKRRVVACECVLSREFQRKVSRVFAENLQQTSDPIGKIMRQRSIASIEEPQPQGNRVRSTIEQRYAAIPAVCRFITMNKRDVGNGDSKCISGIHERLPLSMLVSVWRVRLQGERNQKTPSNQSLIEDISCDHRTIIHVGPMHPVLKNVFRAGRY
jgi:hypothetical protein